MSTKTLLIGLSMILSVGSASAATRLISCKSEAAHVPNLIVELNGNSLVEARMGTEVVWTFTDTSISESAKIALENDRTEFTKEMIKKAAAKESIDSATLIVSANSEGDIYEQLEYVADDGAGYVLLEYKNQKGETVNGSIFAGWGGFFNKCKTVK